MTAGGRPEIRDRARPTPQAHIFTLLQRHVRERRVLVSSSAVVETMDRLGISEAVTRLTLSRMVERDYLQRHRSGRRTCFAITARAGRILDTNESRVRESLAGAGRHPVADSNTWTLLSFSIPETRRRDRRALRVKLAWSGFGPLRDGVWIAAGERDVSDIVEELSLEGCIDLFVGEVRVPESQSMVSRVWELGELRAGYDLFLARWDRQGMPPEARDELGAEVMLITEWRQLVRAYPDVPPRYLPGDWPVAHCVEVVRRGTDAYAEPAQTLFSQILATG